MKHEYPIVDRVRKARHEISEAHGHDTKQLLAHYMKVQEQHRDRFVTKERPPDRKKTAVS